MKLHLNWSGCNDWNETRAKLRFLKTTLFGNFADLEGDCEVVKTHLTNRGFKTTCESYFHGAILLRLTDG